MSASSKATRIQLLDFKSIPMRTFHITWMSFFICFFSWFGIAPLMPVIKVEMGLSKGQIGNIMMASVAMTVIMRVLLGFICDKIGPRRTYAWLLFLGALPVFAISFSQSYESFLICRLLIGGVGAGFVLTQYHTTTMFAKNIVGTANATTAGWGNLGGGVTQMVMPLLMGGFLFLGFNSSMSWRLTMVIPAIMMIVFGVLYLKYTKDTPDGNLERSKPSASARKFDSSLLMGVLTDKTTWILFLAYAACFGIELTVNNIAALYLTDKYDLSLKLAGLIAGLFGAMNIFARSLGGYLSDKCSHTLGLKGRINFLFAVLLMEGIAIVIFSQMGTLVTTVMALILFSITVQMAEGATFSVVPYVSQKSLGLVAGIVGAGGNIGAIVAAGLFKNEGFSYDMVFLIIGCSVAVTSFLIPMLHQSNFEAVEEEPNEPALVYT